MDRMVSTSLSSIAVISRKPSPRCEANSSPSIVPRSVSEKPMRRPVKISGRVAGIRMCQPICAGVSRIARPARRYVRLTLRTAFMVKSTTGMMPCSGAERDLGRHAEAEQQQDHRIERDLGQRIEPDQDRLGDLARQAMAAQQDADADAAQRGDRQRLGEGEAGLPEMRQEALWPIISHICSSVGSGAVSAVSPAH